MGIRRYTIIIVGTPLTIHPGRFGPSAIALYKYTHIIAEIRFIFHVDSVSREALEI